MIGRDHLDTGSVASPNRETEGMRDGSDAIADWPILNALLNASAGATWVSVHHGGGVGIGYSLHAGMVIVADGTREADEKLERVLTCDPGIGRRPPRGCRLSRSDRHGAGARGEDSDAGAMTAALPGLDARLVVGAGRERRRASRCCSGRAAPAGRRALQRLRDGLPAGSCQYIDVERVMSSPEQFLGRVTADSPLHWKAPAHAPAGPREAYEHALAYFAGATSAGRRPGDIPAR